MTKDRWATPQEVDDITLAFPSDVLCLMPPYDQIPAEFKRTCRWVMFQQDWFYRGIDPAGLIPRGGIDKRSALRHLAAIQGSFDPKHEHKEAAVAYLASRWFTDNSTWTVVKRQAS